MVELQTPQMNSVFHALGDATRRQMIRALADGERTVSELAEPFSISLVFVAAWSLPKLWQRLQQKKNWQSGPEAARFG